MTVSPEMHLTTVGDREIAITRTFGAPRPLVFRAWTEPELVRAWMGPASWRFLECEIDLRVGGGWRFVQEGPGGERMVITGVYREVVVPERLVTTENFDVDWTGGETLVTTDFTEAAGRTTVRVVVRYASAAARAGALGSGMEHGMAEGYRRLDGLLPTMEEQR